MIKGCDGPGQGAELILGQLADPPLLHPANGFFAAKQLLSSSTECTENASGPDEVLHS